MADQTEEKDIAGSKVMIVDDNVQNLELMQAYLEELPVETLTATNGLEAMKLVGKGDVDLVLLDIMMPRMSGFEVCHKIKTNPATRDIPIIMITALNEISDMERAVECGTDDFLTKPVNKVELLTRVRSLLRLRHYKNDLERTLAYLTDLEMRRPE